MALPTQWGNKNFSGKKIKRCFDSRVGGWGRGKGVRTKNGLKRHLIHIFWVNLWRGASLETKPYVAYDTMPLHQKTLDFSWISLLADAIGKKMGMRVSQRNRMLSLCRAAIFYHFVTNGDTSGRELEGSLFAKQWNESRQWCLKLPDFISGHPLYISNLWFWSLFWMCCYLLVASHE